jgi:succinyl-diaminopimelate desuccinylase
MVFGAHLDVVPADLQRWQNHPFRPVEKDGKIFGRGAVDMLGGLCAAASTLAGLHNRKKTLNGRIVLAATAGEETDSCGVKRFIDQFGSQIKNPVGIVITEPTGMKILRAHRGILWLNIQTFGKTAHGSMPQLGVNAILKMNAFLNRFENWSIPHTTHPLLGGCSISPNQITGGSATNIVPDSCCLEVDIRTLPGQRHEDIINNLRELCDGIEGDDPDLRTQISVIRTVDALETPADSPFIQTVCQATGIHETQAAGFTTDGPHFKELNAPVVIVGPGDGALCHKPDEYIEINALQHAEQTYEAIVDELFS